MEAPIYLNDVRLKNTLKDILWPSLKQDMNPRSLNYLRLVFRDKKKCVLFATFPRSGWNWTVDIMSYYIIKNFTGRYDVVYGSSGTLKEREKKPYRLVKAADSRARNEKPIKKIFPELNLDFCFHTHDFWKRSPLWGLNNSKTVLITRNIPTILYSYYKAKRTKYSNIHDVIKKGNLDRLIEFYNSWGEFCRKNENYKIFKYEDLRNEPIRYFGNIIEYAFSIKVNTELLGEACEYYSFEKQKQREYEYCNDDIKHFHYKGLTNYNDLIPRDALKIIYSKIENGLQHKFDYHYPTSNDL